MGQEDSGDGINGGECSVGTIGYNNKKVSSCPKAVRPLVLITEGEVQESD